MHKVFKFLTQTFWKILKKYLILINNFIFANYVQIKLSNFIIANYIRNSKKEHLLNRGYLNELLSRIGLYYNPNFYCNPSFLHKYLNTGLLMLQYPHQFSQFLITLSHYNIKSYFELGTGLGGSFITIVEYLAKFNPNFQYAVGIDINHYVSMHIYSKFNKAIKYLIMDSQSLAFKDYIKKSPMFDLIFIDSNHSYEYCKSDFETVKGKAKMIALHDILEKEVDAVWKYIKESYSDEYIFLEFTDQYLKNSKYLGIGLLIRKDI